METIGERIKRLRLAMGMSQRDLADIRVSYAYISRVENNDRDPSEKALRKMAAKLGVTAHYLEAGDTNVECPHCSFNNEMHHHVMWMLGLETHSDKGSQSREDAHRNLDVLLNAQEPELPQVGFRVDGLGW